MAVMMEERLEEVSFLGLKEFEDTVPQSVKDQIKKKPKKKKKEPAQEKEPIREELKQFWKNVHGACEKGDEEQLKTALENGKGTITEEEINQVLNEKNICGETILHKVASEGRSSTVKILMLYGADPTVKDKKAQTPYDHAVDKITRNIFRRFMGDFPDKYDYSKSHIPSILSDDIEAEISEKRKAARKAKRLKDKERKVEKEVIKKEEEEKDRFLSLSDREKRALAAERRILSASGVKNLVLSRCFSCGCNMTGKVPFEYETFRFCSMDCLKIHRNKSKKS